MNISTVNNIKDTILQFDSIKLEEMDGVSLMRRVDSKYVFSIQKLPEILIAAMDKYFMLDIDGQREQKYETTYYDTSNYELYRNHHRGRLNRHKVRTRKYIYSKKEYLEVKFKNNRSETIKTRMKINTNLNQINSSSNIGFLKKNIPYSPNDLMPMLENGFVRLTLVNRNFKERITIDYNLKFQDLQGGGKTESTGICIAEVKRNRDDKDSDFTGILDSHRIKTMGFSKYCVGLAMLNNNLKSNLFKQRLRKIEKHAFSLI